MHMQNLLKGLLSTVVACFPEIYDSKKILFNSPSPLGPSFWNLRAHKQTNFLPYFMQALDSDQAKQVLDWIPDQIRSILVSKTSNLQDTKDRTFPDTESQEIISQVHEVHNNEERSPSLEISSSLESNTEKENQRMSHTGEKPISGQKGGRRGSLMNQREGLSIGRPRSKSILRDNRIRENLKKPVKDVSISSMQSQGTQTEGQDWNSEPFKKYEPRVDRFEAKSAKTLGIENGALEEIKPAKTLEPEVEILESNPETLHETEKILQTDIGVNGDSQNLARNNQENNDSVGKIVFLVCNHLSF